MTYQRGAADMREAAARVAEAWQSSLRPGSTDRLSGHNEAAREIGRVIRALPDPPAPADEVTEAMWLAGVRAIRIRRASDRLDAEAVYRAMIAARDAGEGL